MIDALVCHVHTRLLFHLDITGSVFLDALVFSLMAVCMIIGGLG